MSTAAAPRVGYWLTPAGCRATGGHVPHQDGQCTVCTVCGTQVPRTPQQMLQRALLGIGEGKDPQRYVDVAIAWVEKWARLAEEWDSHGDRASQLMDGRASIYTGETYAEARGRWQAYLHLLTDHLLQVEHGLKTGGGLESSQGKPR